MKVAIIGESPADEAAVRVLINRVMGRTVQPVSFSARRAPGIAGVFTILPAALKELHYHTDADGIVVVVDTDRSPIHTDVHDQPGKADEHCRLCRLRQVVNRTQDGLRSVPGRLPLKVAFGVAVPTIEAWYRCGIGSRVSEAAWRVALQSHSYLYTGKSLKQAVYGTDRPALTLETQRAAEEAQRLGQDLILLERLFPAGFGALAQSLRSW